MIGDSVTKEELVAAEDRLRIRIMDLERQNKSLRWLTGLVGAGLLVPLGLVGALFHSTPSFGGSAEEVMEARSFVLKDASGVSRGEWAITDDGAARLTLKDRSGVARVNVAVLEGGAPGLSFANAQGERRVVLGLLPDQTSTLVFADREGVPRAVIGLSRDESASLVFADGEGVTRVGLGVEAGGVGSVLLPESP